MCYKYYLHIWIWGNAITLHGLIDNKVHFESSHFLIIPNPNHIQCTTYLNATRDVKVTVYRTTVSFISMPFWAASPRQGQVCPGVEDTDIAL